jgi:hypothetical protein
VTETRREAHLLDMLPVGASEDVSHPSGPVPGEGTRPATPSASDLRAQIAALYREHFQFVWRSLRRMGVADRSIDDAVQDVFRTGFFALLKPGGTLISSNVCLGDNWVPYAPLLSVAR